MRAPVYRHLDARTGLLGLTVLEWAPLLLLAWTGMVLDRPNLALLGALLGYGVLRLAGHGRAEGHLQHAIAWHLRQARSGGRLSAAARARAPRFPFAPYAFRDRSAGGGAP